MNSKNRLFYERLSTEDFSRLKLKRLARSLSDKDKEQVENLKASSREFLSRYPSDRIVPQIRERFQNTQTPIKEVMHRFFFVMRFAVPAAACLCAVLLLKDVIFPQGPSVRFKGVGPSFSIYKKLDDGAEKINNLSRAMEGDELQLSYKAGSNRYGAIISVDSRGAMTLHYPLTINGSKELNGEGEVLLPYSYRLDDAPDFEMFFFITSETDFPLEKVVNTIKDYEDPRNQDISFSRSLDIETLILLKGE